LRLTSLLISARDSNMDSLNSPSNWQRTYLILVVVDSCDDWKLSNDCEIDRACSLKIGPSVSFDDPCSNFTSLVIYDLQFWRLARLVHFVRALLDHSLARNGGLCEGRTGGYHKSVQGKTFG
jgi:hypothetical protein